MKVESSLEGGVAVVTFEGPGANVLRPPAFDELIEAVEELFAHESLKALVLRGAGRHFSAGADLEALERMLESDEPTLRRELEAGRRLVSLLDWAPVPTVAMIRGSCLGGGLELAAACHFRIASERSLLGFPETTHGLLQGLGAAVSLRGIVPRGRALELLLTGRTLTGREAEELGLVDRAVPTRELEAETRAFVDGLVGSRSPGVVRAVVASIHDARRSSPEEAMRREGDLFFEVARARAHVAPREDVQG